MNLILGPGTIFIIVIKGMNEYVEVKDNLVESVLSCLSVGFGN